MFIEGWWECLIVDDLAFGVFVESLDNLGGRSGASDIHVYILHLKVVNLGLLSHCHICLSLVWMCWSSYLPIPCFWSELVDVSSFISCLVLYLYFFPNAYMFARQPFFLQSYLTWSSCILTDLRFSVVSIVSSDNHGLYSFFENSSSSWHVMLYVDFTLSYVCLLRLFLMLYFRLLIWSCLVAMAILILNLATTSWWSDAISAPR